MNGYRYGVCPAVAVLCLAAVAGTTGRPLAATVVVGALAVTATLLGVLLHGRTHPLRWQWSWAFLTTGLVASVSATLLGAGSAGRASADVVALLGGVCSIVGLVRLLRQRLGAHGADVTFEAVLTTAAVGFVLCTVLLQPMGATGTLAGGGGMATVTRPLLDLVAVWLAVRLVSLTPTHPPAYRYLLGGLLCLLAADVLAAGLALGGSASRQPVALLLWSFCLRAAAACHPSLGAAFEPVADGPKRLRRPQLVLIVGLVLLGPTVLTARVALGGTLDMSVVLGSALVPLLVVVHLIRHVQERASAEYEAQHDALTGLPNRLLFHDRVAGALAQARASGSRVAVMFLDLDRFKSINDSRGHTVGNELLKSAGRRLQACLRDTDTVARVGGDEFTLLVPSVTTAAESAALAERVLQALAAPFLVADRELFTTASIGVALFPDDGTDPETLLKHADTAMYRAKASGRDGFQLYTSDMSTRAQVKHSLENSLRHAIECHDLVLHYQPKVGIADGKVVGLEALLRWPHPILGWVGPDTFIPLAEETGLIGPLGEWAVEEACQQIAIWRDAGLHPVPVAVNLSARELAQSPVVDLIAGALARAGVAPELLEVEITESVFLHDPQEATDKLHRLRAMGVRCSIDDFGTGYSGLSYLARLPLDSLKIDRSFVQRIGAAHEDEAIVDAVIALAHSLRLKVVAEGVETDEQARYLRSRGCDQMQGFLFSPALPPEDAALLLDARLPIPERRHLVLVGNDPAPATSGSVPAQARSTQPVPGAPSRDLGCLLRAVCDDADLGRPDPQSVAALVAALEPSERVAGAEAPWPWTIALDPVPASRPLTPTLSPPAQRTAV